jgi:phage shock protein C
MEPKHLYRSLTDRKIAGVAGGLAEYFDTDPLLIRLAFVVLALAGGGGVLIYFILWIVTPEKPFSYGQFTSKAGSQPNPDPFSSSGKHDPDPFSATGKPDPDPFTASGQPKNNTSDPFKTPEPPKNSNSDPFGAHHHNKGSLIGGLVLITLGSLFLIDQFIPNINFGDLWPVILVVIGGGLLFNALSGRK